MIIKINKNIKNNIIRIKKQNLKDNKYINILMNIYTKEKQK